MPTFYDDQLKAQVTTDEHGGVTHIRHSQESYYSESNDPLEAARTYVRTFAGVLSLGESEVDQLHVPVQALEPLQQDVRYRLEGDKALFDGATISFAQTFFDVPVFRRGISIKIKQGPARVVAVANNVEADLRGELPGADPIERYQRLFRGGAGFLPHVAPGEGEDTAIPDEVREAAAEARTALGLGQREESDEESLATGLLNGRFVAYRYNPQRRYAGTPGPDRPTPVGEDDRANHESGTPPLPDLPPVDDGIETGRTYLCAELIVRQSETPHGDLVWLVLRELETGSILYIECQTCFVNGLVFRIDPNVGSGDLTVTSGDGNAILQNHVSSEVLHHLNPPAGGVVQLLRGTYVSVQNVEAPAIAPPNRPPGANFDYVPRSDHFAAVNAYYHQTELFRRIADLGFPVATYFDGTTFPIPVDHRGHPGMDGLGLAINAHWSPNGSGGTHHMCYALCDQTNLTEPLGRSVDPWVHWHEMGGHGTLGDHAGGGLLGFAHSHGDGLAALQMDPDSALRGVPQRFDYAPFHPTLTRRFDRTWPWGSAQDNGNDGYGAEQILATCHFRFYRSIGGDHPDAGRRRFASRAATYLILRATGELTPVTNPNNTHPVTMAFVPGRGAQLWCEELQDADLENWTSEGLSGGAYNKVIRWAFEEQGSYGGLPPAVDVYIDDGRGGEYPFQHVHWANMSMWNRNTPDGLPDHQNAVSDTTNYFYARIRNRGTSASGTVTVQGYHCLPGAGLVWPNDFTTMTPAAGLTTPSVPANSSNEAVVGPFQWVPNENALGHDCVLMIATTAGDPSNVSHFTGSESIQEWRLVPNDNNVGQRNVTVVPGGGGLEALVSSMAGAVFVAGNNLTRHAVMELKVTMPTVLADRGWSLDIDDVGRFQLKPGEKRTLQLRLVPGAAFTAADLRAAGDQRIDVRLLADGMELGGVQYTVDPDLKERSGGKPKRERDCTDAARSLLDCLDVGGGRVKRVEVKRVNLDIKFHHDDCD